MLILAFAAALLAPLGVSSQGPASSSWSQLLREGSHAAAWSRWVGPRYRPCLSLWADWVQVGHIVGQIELGLTLNLHHRMPGKEHQVFGHSGGSQVDTIDYLSCLLQNHAARPRCSHVGCCSCLYTAVLLASLVLGYSWPCDQMIAPAIPEHGVDRLLPYSPSKAYQAATLDPI